MAINRLTAATVEAETKRKTKTAKLLHDGGGLYLQVTAAGSVSWIFRYGSPATGKRREMGLGPASMVTLAAARDRAIELRRKVHVDKIDPLDDRKAGKSGRTFRAQFEHMIAHEPRPGWREQLELHVMPVIGDKLITAITTDNVIAIIAKQIDGGHHETARKLQQRIHAVIRSATGNIDTVAHKVRIVHTLSKFKKVRKGKHHPAIHIDKLPAFMRDLRERKEIAACALEFVILTVCRTGDVTGQRRKHWPTKPPMLWSDIKGRVWTVPAIKTADDANPEPFEIPLSDAALDVLDRVRALHSNPEIVFPMQQHLGKRPRGQKIGKDGPMDRGAIRDQIVRRGHNGFTVHGMRSVFRQFASERNGRAENDVIETCLAHSVFSENKTEAAYKGSVAFFNKRKTLLQRWAEYATGKSKVVALKKAA